ncbi:hypothetical protein FG05_35150 [Fusarium graminearum]|nr:hypothetical protein FG05_35150 [Fusarium graminearum]
MNSLGRSREKIGGILLMILQTCTMHEFVPVHAPSSEPDRSYCPSIDTDEVKNSGTTLGSEIILCLCLQGVTCYSISIDAQGSLFTCTSHLSVLRDDAELYEADVFWQETQSQFRECTSLKG